MTRQALRMITSNWMRDEQPIALQRRDLSGGMNTRQHPTIIGENQAENLNNVDLGTPGSRRKRLGSVLIGDDKGSTSPSFLHNYERQGYADNLMMTAGTTLYASEAEGNWATVKADFTSSAKYGIVSAKESGITPDDIIIVQNGTDNPFRFQKDSSEAWQTQDLGSTSGTGTDSPPKSRVMCWYGNRVWVLKNDQLYFSAAYSADYSGAFDTVSDVYRVPVGEERALVPTRDLGIIIFGKSAVWGLAPSATPAATDKPEPIITSYGAVSEQGVVSVGDDIYFFAQDGLRSLKRTVQDKLQMGASYPISYSLKDEFDEIDWAYIDRVRMEYFDNKIFITVPTGSTTFKTWIYYPATNSFSIMTGVSPTAYSTYEVGGEERLYYGAYSDTVVYRGWYGYTDEGTTVSNGTAITMTEEGREEDFGLPLTYKAGGEVEVEVNSPDASYTMTVYAKPDGGDYVELGSISMGSSSSPTLPVALPFTLSDSFVIREKFHLDSLGRFRSVQIKLVNSDANTEDIIIYGVGLATFSEEYETE